MAKSDNNKIKILFLGDIFGERGVQIVVENLPKIIKQTKPDLVICQAENVSGRKGLTPADYQKLKNAGVNVFTLGNHVWGKEEILQIINNDDIARPGNIESGYAGKGSVVFTTKHGKTVRIVSLMGITFNKLLPPWRQEVANNFFDYMDYVLEREEKTDFVFVDFHAETTSEKAVLALYLDGKVDAIVGTHTHVQTNDARILPKGTAFCTDAGMCGTINSAIGANFEEVYLKMRYGAKALFKASEEKECQICGVLCELNSLNKENNKISLIKQFFTLKT
ncbi:TIGR00282 family metallophosphoesterase [Mycoplasmopsis columbinasalis]|nr:TIGR00282 family metallophosphoesterase [Mycoplasmopsis columbinasalis]